MEKLLKIKIVPVVIGLIFNDLKQILVAQRPPHVPLGGLWEFPGGKVEVGEDYLDALRRELSEEVGIDVLEATFLGEYEDRQPHQILQMTIWKVNRFQGQAQGMEGQPIRWVHIHELAQLSFPKANQQIIQHFRFDRDVASVE